jgi:hypothetical protein
VQRLPSPYAVPSRLRGPGARRRVTPALYRKLRYNLHSGRTSVSTLASAQSGLHRVAKARTRIRRRDRLCPTRQAAPDVAKAVSPIPVSQGPSDNANNVRAGHGAPPIPFRRVSGLLRDAAYFRLHGLYFSSGFFLDRGRHRHSEQCALSPGTVPAPPPLSGCLVLVPCAAGQATPSGYCCPTLTTYRTAPLIGGVKMGTLSGNIQ